MILDHLLPGRILLAGRARDKRDVLAEMASLLADSDPALAEVILAGLLERESLMSTGIGHGIALPHARLERITEMRLALARYPQGVSFKSLDDQPVHLAFGVIGPPSEADRHVKLLARIARLVKQGSAVAELQAAKSVDGVIEVLKKFSA